VKIKQIILRHMKMSLLSPFTTSFMTLKEKEFILIEVLNHDGLSGWGESVALTIPLYNEETLKTNWHILEDFLIPIVLKNPISHPEKTSQLFSHIKANYMAKSALEGAIWDLYAKEQNITLAQALGGKLTDIEVGISIGIQENISDLLSLISQYVQDGYKRIKLKIKPGWDVEIIRQVRQQFPDIPLMADANSAYTLQDINSLKELDNFNLMMIEQPLAHDDIIDHAQLQKHLNTPICLDESIHSEEDARKAIQLGSCRIINIKIGRVGGLTEARKIHNLCLSYNIPVWCGGMLESGIGRAHNIALTALPNFSLPGDTAASSRYWDQDIILPEVTVHKGIITIPSLPGIGYKVNKEKIEKLTLFKKTYD